MSPSTRPTELERALQKITDYKNELVAVVLHLNDTYLIEERRNRKLPGFPKIIAAADRLRTHVKNETGQDKLLVVHSGDFLSPSLLSKKDYGEAMVELLNKLGVDYCVLGNHEFDKGVRGEELAKRLQQAHFKVLLANSTDKTGLIEHDPTGLRNIKIARMAIWPEDGRNPPPLVALTGVVSADVHESFKSPDPTAARRLIPPDKVEWRKWEFTPPNEALIEFLDAIRNAEEEADSNVPFRILLTHATQAEDKQLRAQIPGMSRTFILGGHDHDIEWVQSDKKVSVMKNLANAETVRVLLLMAGGDLVVREVYRTYKRLQARELETTGRTLRYPGDLEAVLLSTSGRDREVIRNGIENAKPRRGFRDLEQALGAARPVPDFLEFTLRYKDYGKAAPHDIAYVRKALRVAVREGERTPFCDLSRFGAKLDARDAHIRRHSTNLGVFVAECVRRYAGAKVAIINSGAFRCDCQMAPKLSMHALRETFLYDEPDAIIVLDVESDDVTALIEHGTNPAKGGTGAWAQYSDKRRVKKGTVRLAISSFILTQDNNDGYDKLLQKCWNLPKPEDLHVRVRNESDKVRKASDKPANFGIIEAVLAKAKTVAAQPPKAMFGVPAGPAGSPTDEIIRLLKNYADTFWTAFYRTTNPSARAFVSSPMFETWLGDDEPIPRQPAIEKARNEVRAFLRQLPAVAACTRPIQAAASTSTAAEALTAAEKELRTLQRSLIGHDAVFRDGYDYPGMFDLAARWIKGWFPPYYD